MTYRETTFVRISIFLLGAPNYSSIMVLIIYVDSKPWKRKSLAGALIGYLIVYIYLMFLYRLPGSYRLKLVLTPFSSYEKAMNYQGNISTNQFLRSILFNILLFIPLGMILSSLCNGLIIFPFLVGLIISILSETIQYISYLGWAETDDVINNSLGMLLGIEMYRLFIRIQRKHKKP